MNLCLSMFAITSLILVSQRTKFLMVLLALEAMTLTLIIIMGLLLSKASIIILILLISFGACEVTAGLALLTAMSRRFGTDNLSALSSPKYYS